METDKAYCVLFKPARIDISRKDVYDERLSRVFIIVDTEALSSVKLVLGENGLRSSEHVCTNEAIYGDSAEKLKLRMENEASKK
ncbi:hypothetical protein SUGI_0921500 [Cryptomeria japonica]|nr:hypothetical protein SUGI_0921500 [Cryptomeria japonica]